VPQAHHIGRHFDVILFADIVGQCVRGADTSADNIGQHVGRYFDIIYVYQHVGLCIGGADTVSPQFIPYF